MRHNIGIDPPVSGVQHRPCAPYAKVECVAHQRIELGLRKCLPVHVPANTCLGGVQSGCQLGIDLRGCYWAHQFFCGARTVMRESTDSKVSRQLTTPLFSER